MRYGVLPAILASAAFAAAGCSNTATTTSSSPSTSASPSTAAVVLDVTIAKGQATPANTTLHAHVGQPITVHVTSDAADELHVHSTPDHEFAISATPNQAFNFTIDSPGKVEVELHHLDQTVATIDVAP